VSIAIGVDDDPLCDTGCPWVLLIRGIEQMTDRLLLVALGVLGLLAIVVAFVFRKDLARLTGSGPRWRRALFGAGLALLAPFGVGCAHKQPVEEQATDDDVWAELDLGRREQRERVCKPRGDEAKIRVEKSNSDSLLTAGVVQLVELEREDDRLSRQPMGEKLTEEYVCRRDEITGAIEAIRRQLTSECGRRARESLPRPTADPAVPIGDDAEARWRELEGTWKEAAQIYADERHPLDQAAKHELLADIDRAEQTIQSLVASGQLSTAGSEFLTIENTEIRNRVAGLPTTEGRSRPTSTCYVPMPFTPAQDGILASLALRLPLLEKLASSSVIRREVVLKVLTQFEYDLAYVRGAEARAKPWTEMSEEELCLAVAWPGSGRWPLPFPDLPDYEKEWHEKTVNYNLTDEERDVVERTQRAVDELRARLIAGEER